MQLERYRIESELGRGAMAAVYKVYDTRAERFAALKLLHRKFFEDSSVRARFIQEAKTISRLRHPAIVPVLHAAQVGEDLFLVMPLMAGGSLSDRLRSGPLPADETVAVLDRIASALDYAHEQGIVHRDVKPDNILFDESGQAYLGDFGVIKLVESNLTLTGTGLIGTPAYMSPEQIQTAKNIDGRSDIYSLGVVLFEMVAGRIPYDGDSEMAVAMKHVNAPIPAVRDFVRTADPEWQPIINRAMAKMPSDRYQTGAEMAADVRALVENQRAPASAGKTAAPPPRGPVAGIIAAMAALLVLGLVVVYLLLRVDDGPSAAATTGPTVMLVEVVVTPTDQPTLPPTAAATEAPSAVPTKPAATATTAATETAEASPTGTATTGADQSTVRANANVFTRLGPGMSFPIVRALTQGQEVPVVARNREGAWYLVQLGAQELAWVSADFVTGPADGAAVPIAATIPAPPRATATTTAATPLPQPTATISAGGGDGGDGGGPVEPGATNTPFVVPTNTPFSLP